MQKNALKMKKVAFKKNGFDTVIPLGTIVHVAVAREDRAHLDPTTVPGMVVEAVQRGKVRQEVKYRIATEAGIMKALRARAEVAPAPHLTPTLVGLPGDTLLNWESLRPVSDRECVRVTSVVGGQGHLHCKCTGSCDQGSRCACRKAGVPCNPRCHKGNSKCRNK